MSEYLSKYPSSENPSNTIDLTSLAYDAMIARGLIPDFPPPLLEELDKISKPIIPIAGLDAADMRSLLWFSIDNDDSRDLDQLTYAKKTPEGKFNIFIAVASVDLLVKKGGAIDARAAQNTTSVYTPTKIFPMLPERLSTDLTSLNEGEDRLAMIFEGIISTEGKLEEGKLYQAYVHNHAQLAYDSISEWLDGKGPIPQKVAETKDLEAQIRLQDSITEILGRDRHESGALSVETIEPHLILSDGNPVEITVMEKNRGRRLIENFMIIANTISARYADRMKLNSLRRVVVVPRRWDKIVEVAAEKGTFLPDTPDAPALEQFIVEQKEKSPDTFPDLSLTIIKLLGRGEYKVAIPGIENPGHFGLALRDYTHSTAPNRRFPDLITQRILLASLQNLPQPYSLKQLETLAAHCTEKEDDSDKIERKLKKCAEAVVLSGSIGKEFNAIVTGAGEKGTWVRLFKPPVEGKLIKGERGVDVGDKIRVKLVYTDPRAGFIDFTRVN